MSKKHSAVLSNFNSRCPGEFFEEKIVLSEGIQIVNSVIRSWKVFGRVVKTALYMSGRTFLGNITYCEISYSCFCFHASCEFFGTFTNEIGRVFKMAFSICSGNVEENVV